MKRKFVTLLLSLGLVCGLGGLSACADENGSASVENSDTETVFTMQTAYMKAQELGYEGSLEEFIASISGKNGLDGINGKDGEKGKDGVGIASVYFNESNQLVVKYTDGREEVVGKIPTCVHSYGDWIEDKKATCASIGVNYRVCTDCGYVEYEITPNVGHYLVSEFVTSEGETLCENGGAYAMHCVNEGCEYVQSGVEVSAQGHHSVAWEIITEPTLETEGKLEGVCTGCEVTVDEERKITYKGCGATIEMILPILSEKDYMSEGRTSCGIEEMLTYSIAIDGQEFSFERVAPAKGTHTIALNNGETEEIASGSVIERSEQYMDSLMLLVTGDIIHCGSEPAAGYFECAECGAFVQVYIKIPHTKPEGLEEGVTEYECTVCKQQVTE